MAEYCGNSFYNQDLHTPKTGSNRDAVGKTTAEMQTYAFAIALNGKEGSAWTSTGTDYPVLSGGMAPTAEIPTGVTATVGTRLSGISVPNPQSNTPGVWVRVEPEKSVGSGTGERAFDAVFFPADADYTPVRASITVKVKKSPVLTITDNASTPEIEVTIENAEAGWCVAAIYSADGQMLSCGQADVKEGNSSLAITLGEYEHQERIVIRAFLLDGQFIPQAAAAGKP